MTPETLRQVEELFHQVRQLGPTERDLFVANIADSEIRAEVSSLLAADAADAGEVAPDLGIVVDDAVHAALQEPSAGGLVGHFRVLREIGRGGMGIVYLAEDLKLERQVALKLLPPGLHRNREWLHRFEREARLPASLNHPNIVTVFQTGEWEGRPFIAAEFVEGETLAQNLERGPVSPRIALVLADQILSALEAAHATGIIHRDLKPANVMVRPDGTVKVLDFGLARVVVPTHPPNAKQETVSLTGTIPGRILGTPAYMAPEQWEGRQADARSDIYAFGCALYEILTGRRANVSRQPVSSRALENIVRRCLEQDPAARWQSAADLRSELARVPRGRSRSRIMGIAAGAVLVIAALFAWEQRTRASPLSDKDVVVLSDFQNNTGDPVFDGALRQSLAIQLEQSPFLKIMDDAQMRQDLRLMGRSAAERITDQIAHDICVRDGAAAIIEGSITGLGRAYAITLQGINCNNGATLARQQVKAEDKEHVLEAVDKAATGMRAKLGESLTSVEKLTRPLDQFTTPSLEALQRYASGHTLQAQGQFLAAIPFYQRATELDPNFAMAYVGLALAYNNAGDIPRAKEYQRKAFAFVDRVSDFERLWISARYYWRVTEELDRAIDAYRAITRDYPRFWGAHSELNFLYNSTGQFEKALEEGREAVRLEPRAEPSYRNLATAYIKLDRLAEAEEVLARARAQHFDGSRLHERFLEIAYIRGDQAAIDRELQWYAGKPEEYLSFRLQAAYADSLGRHDQAVKLYGRAEEMARQRGLTHIANDFEDAAAGAAAFLGDCQPARRAGHPTLALAICGDAARAEKLAGEASKLHPLGTLWNAVERPLIRAAIALTRERPAEAIELLQSAKPYERAFPESFYLRGLSYLRLEKRPEARDEFRNILDHKGANWGLIYALADRSQTKPPASAQNSRAQE
jgi:tetratricopeptide (TPR) repeat protein